MSKKTIAILGGGNGAHTMAADLAMRGYRVRMYEDAAFIGKLSVLRETLTIRCTGLLTGEGKIDLLTDNMAEAIDGADYIAVVTPSTAHVSVAKKLKGLVKRSRPSSSIPAASARWSSRRCWGRNALSSSRPITCPTTPGSMARLPSSAPA